MKRLALGLLVILANLSVAKSSLAQTPETAAPEPAGGDKTPADTGPAITPDLDLGEIPGSEATAPETKKAAEGAGAPRKSWEDIVVVPRKAFLKKSRLEIAPFAGITLNDPLIRHYSFGLSLIHI